MHDLVIDREAGLYHFRENDRTFSYPSVTAILGDTIGRAWSTSDELPLLRGRAVHRACALIDAAETPKATGTDGTGLDWSSVDELLKPYIEAWQRFKQDSKFVPMWIERPVRSHVYRFAGTPDRVAFLYGENPPWIVDIKGPSHDPTYLLQPAGYGAAVLEAQQEAGFTTKGAPLRCITVHLGADGKYHVFPLSKMADLMEARATFLSAVRVYHFRRTHGYPIRTSAE